jgi:hypothetical protein
MPGDRYQNAIENERDDQMRRSSAVAVEVESTLAATVQGLLSSLG